MNSALAEPQQKSGIVVGLALACLLGSLAAESAAQDFRFRDGRFFETLGGVTLQRADEASSDEAVRNMPFLPGDRVWTDDAGRAEILFAEGEILWIAERSKVDSLGRGGREQDERLGLRVFAGSFGARVRPGGPGFEFRVPGGSLTTAGASAFRIDVRAGETLVSVREGEVLIDLAGKRMTVRAGERVRYAGQTVDGPFRYQLSYQDSFDVWREERFAELNRMAANRNDRRLPEELQAYGDELDRNGEWVYEEPQGYVYVPRVAYGWAPYTYGRWSYTLYGWTWVAAEPWGFATSHYGRWGYSARIGWHWMPRAGFAGAWVGWSTPVGSWGNTVGWCALGVNDRPVGSFGYGSDGHAVPRSSVQGRGWSFANQKDMGRADIHRRLVDLPAGEIQRVVAWDQGTSPDRQFRDTRSGSERRGASRGEGASEAVSRGGQSRGVNSGPLVYVRPSPGDSTPELRSDPTTTIPSPESRRERTIGQDGYKDQERNRASRTRLFFAVEGAASQAASDDPRAQPSDRGTERAQPASNDAAKKTDRERAPRDPLLRGFFRSITSPTSDREANPRGDDASAKKRESPPRDDSSAGEATTRERSRPAEATPADQNRERDRSRPTGAERPQPKHSPPPQSSPRGGGSDDGRAARRRPQPGQ